MSVHLINGDSRTVLAGLPAGSVHCCITSPPYYGLRDYGVSGQIGLEPTPDEYVAEMVTVFREVRRVLRDDGTLWLNIGDSYAGSASASGWREGSARADGEVRDDGNARCNRNGVGPVLGCKPKDLIGIPWMLAFALRADGWYLRQDIIWSKPNPMPESVTDRCTKAHEYLFLLSKSGRYYFDADAMKEDATSDHPAGNKRHKYADQYEAEKDQTQQHRTKAGLKQLAGVEWKKRNRRSVWTVTTKPFAGAHFATFPPDLIEPCILAGCPVDGTVLDPFIGSGTTGLVAHNLRRNCIGVELNPKYVAIATARLKADLVAVEGGIDLPVSGLALFDRVGAA